MITPIHVLERKGISTSSRCGAIQDIKEKFIDVNWKNELEQLLGDCVTTFNAKDDEELKYTYLYVVQNLIAGMQRSEKMDFAQLLQISHKAAKHTIYRLTEGDMSFVRAKSEDVEKGPEKRSKGEQAIDLFTTLKPKGKKAIIEAFMKELDMSKQGATTYYYTTKKKVEEK